MAKRAAKSRFYREYTVVRKVTLYREDFNSTLDSEGTPYFHYLLSGVGVPENQWDKIEAIEITVTGYHIESTVDDNDAGDD